MNKHRFPPSNDYSLRLQEVVPEHRTQLPEPRAPRYPYPAESHDSEKDTVVALTWPQETSWHHH